MKSISIAGAATMLAAVGSLGLLLWAGRRAPGFLLVLFVGWVLSPFLVLAWASLSSKRWSAATRTTLDRATWVVALGSLGMYGYAVFTARSTPTATFLLVPLASWLVMTVAFSLAAWMPAMRPRRGGRA